MYQGKFDAKTRGHESPDENLQKILEERSAAQAAAAARAAALKKAQAARQAGAQRTAADQNAPAPAAKAPVRQAAPQEPVKQAKQVKTAQPAQKETRRGPRVGGVIFYTLYFLMIFIFCGGMFFVLQWLNGWLTDYEAAQPTIKCEEVFHELFDHPDWAALYEMADVEDTEYEGVDEYVSYMEGKVAGQSLNYVETSAGLHQGKKYIVRLGTEKIASFYLDGQGEKVTDIPDWKLGKVELFFQRQEGYLIQKLDGHVAYVNGVGLDDSFTIQTASTLAEKYLPIGIAGVRTCIQKIDGLMALPEVTVFNQKGEQMEVIYNESTGTFVEQTTETTITDAEREVAQGAIRAYSEFMINAAGSRAAVAKYFDGSSDTYARILKMAQELWMNKDRGHSFYNDEIDWYAKYSDDLFAVHVSTVMKVVGNDNLTKEYPVSESMFFTKKNGKWVCYEMTNEDVSTPVGHVRLTYMDEGVELLSEMAATDATQLMTPVVSDKPGKVFKGWFRDVVGEDGKVKRTLVFTPEEGGKVILNSGTVLEPMTLFAVYENAAEGENNA